MSARVTPLLGADDAARFWSQVAIAGGRGGATSPPGIRRACWLWLGGRARSRGSYGFFYLRGEGREVSAAQLAYRLLRGVLAADRPLLRPTCRNRPCVNPWHHVPVSRAALALQGKSPWAVNARKLRCKAGHLLRGKNVRRDADGRRRCMRCHREWSRAYMRDRRAAARRGSRKRPRRGAAQKPRRRR